MTKGVLMSIRVVFLTLILLSIFVLILAAKSRQDYVLNTSLVEEASGLARSIKNGNILYTHNDSGGENAIFAIDTRGKLKAKIEIANVKNRDWEEIATGIDPKDKQAYIYIGEIGDNGARYPHVSIYKVPEPSLSPKDSLITLEGAKCYNIQYDDGARDAEAFFVDPKSGDIYIISKREEQVGIYRVAYPQSTAQMNIARKMGTMQMAWVTAADISPNGKRILVKNYTGIRRFKLKKSIAHTLAQKGTNLPYKLEPQGEAICFDAKGKAYFTLSEATEGSPQVLYYYK